MIKHFSSSTLGRSHEKTGIENQDRIRKEITKKYLFFGVADGAGSASNSGIGADIALNSALDWLKASKELDKNALLKYIRDKLSYYAKENDCSFNSLSSTLLFAFIRNKSMIIGQIGDGLIAIRDCDRTFEKVFEPQKGEFHNETVFLTSSPDKIQFQSRTITLQKSKKMQCLLSTDGLESVILTKATSEFAPAIYKFFEWISKGDHNEVNEAINNAIENHMRPKTQDDLTICGFEYSLESRYGFMKSVRQVLKRMFSTR